MTILSLLAIVLVGWPGIITALVLVSIGIYTKRIWLIILGVIFSIPISWYLGSFPMFRYIMYGLPLFFIGSALAVKFGKDRLAWILIVPYIVIMVWLGLTVLKPVMKKRSNGTRTFKNLLENSVYDIVNSRENGNGARESVKIKGLT